MQVIFRGTYWLQLWALFQYDGTKKKLRLAILAMDNIVMEVFMSSAWKIQ